MRKPEQEMKTLLNDVNVVVGGASDEHHTNTTTTNQSPSSTHTTPTTILSNQNDNSIGGVGRGAGDVGVNSDLSTNHHHHLAMVQRSVDERLKQCGLPNNIIKIGSSWDDFCLDYSNFKTKYELKPTKTDCTKLPIEDVDLFGAECEQLLTVTCNVCLRIVKASAFTRHVETRHGHLVGIVENRPMLQNGIHQQTSNGPPSAAVSRSAPGTPGQYGSNIDLLRGTLQSQHGNVMNSNHIIHQSHSLKRTYPQDYPHLNGLLMNGNATFNTNNTPTTNNNNATAHNNNVMATPATNNNNKTNKRIKKNKKLMKICNGGTGNGNSLVENNSNSCSSHSSSSSSCSLPNSAASAVLAGSNLTNQSPETNIQTSQSSNNKSLKDMLNMPCHNATPITTKSKLEPAMPVSSSSSSLLLKSCDGTQHSSGVGSLNQSSTVIAKKSRPTLCAAAKTTTSTTTVTLEQQKTTAVAVASSASSPLSHSPNANSINQSTSNQSPAVCGQSLLISNTVAQQVIVPVSSNVNGSLSGSGSGGSGSGGGSVRTPSPVLMPPPQFPVVPRKRMVLCKNRQYDPDQHCGVKLDSMDRPCTRSLTCRSHMISLRRAVLGRSKSFDELLSEYKRARGMKEKRDRKPKNNSNGGVASGGVAAAAGTMTATSPELSTTGTIDTANNSCSSNSNSPSTNHVTSDDDDLANDDNEQHIQQQQHMLVTGNNNNRMVGVAASNNNKQVVCDSVKVLKSVHHAHHHSCSSSSSLLPCRSLASSTPTMSSTCKHQHENAHPGRCSNRRRISKSSIYSIKLSLCDRFLLNRWTPKLSTLNAFLNRFPMMKSSTALTSPSTTTSRMARKRLKHLIKYKRKCFKRKQMINRIIRLKQDSKMLDCPNLMLNNAPNSNNLASNHHKEDTALHRLKRYPCPAAVQSSYRQCEFTIFYVTQTNRRFKFHCKTNHLHNPLVDGIQLDPFDDMFQHNNTRLPQTCHNKNSALMQHATPTNISDIRDKGAVCFDDEENCLKNSIVEDYGVGDDDAIDGDYEQVMGDGHAHNNNTRLRSNISQASKLPGFNIAANQAKVNNNNTTAGSNMLNKQSSPLTPANTNNKIDSDDNSTDSTGSGHAQHQLSNRMMNATPTKAYANGSGTAGAVMNANNKKSWCEGVTLLKQPASNSIAYNAANAPSTTNIVRTARQPASGTTLLRCLDNSLKFVPGRNIGVTDNQSNQLDWQRRVSQSKIKFGKIRNLLNCSGGEQQSANSNMAWNNTEFVNETSNITNDDEAIITNLLHYLNEPLQVNGHWMDEWNTILPMKFDVDNDLLPDCIADLVFDLEEQLQLSNANCSAQFANQDSIKKGFVNTVSNNSDAAGQVNDKQSFMVNPNPFNTQIASNCGTMNPNKSTPPSQPNQLMQYIKKFISSAPGLDEPADTSTNPAHNTKTAHKPDVDCKSGSFIKSFTQIPWSPPTPPSSAPPSSECSTPRSSTNSASEVGRSGPILQSLILNPSNPQIGSLSSIISQRVENNSLSNNTSTSSNNQLVSLTNNGAASGECGTKSLTVTQANSTNLVDGRTPGQLVQSFILNPTNPQIGSQLLSQRVSLDASQSSSSSSSLIVNAKPVPTSTQPTTPTNMSSTSPLSSNQVGGGNGGGGHLLQSFMLNASNPQISSTLTIVNQRCLTATQNVSSSANTTPTVNTSPGAMKRAAPGTPPSTPQRRTKKRNTTSVEQQQSDEQSPSIQPSSSSSLLQSSILSPEQSPPALSTSGNKKQAAKKSCTTPTKKANTINNAATVNETRKKCANAQKKMPSAGGGGGGIAGAVSPAKKPAVVNNNNNQNSILIKSVSGSPSTTPTSTTNQQQHLQQQLMNAKHQGSTSKFTAILTSSVNSVVSNNGTSVQQVANMTQPASKVIPLNTVITSSAFRQTGVTSSAYSIPTSSTVCSVSNAVAVGGGASNCTGVVSNTPTQQQQSACQPPIKKSIIVPFTTFTGPHGTAGSVSSSSSSSSSSSTGVVAQGSGSSNVTSSNSSSSGQSVGASSTQSYTAIPFNVPGIGQTFLLPINATSTGQNIYILHQPLQTSSSGSAAGATNVLSVTSSNTTNATNTNSTDGTSPSLSPTNQNQQQLLVQTIGGQATTTTTATVLGVPVTTHTQPTPQPTNTTTSANGSGMVTPNKRQTKLITSK